MSEVDLLAEIRDLLAQRLPGQSESPAAVAQPVEEPPRLLTATAAAKRIGIDRKTLAKEIAKGSIGTVTVGARQMVPLVEVEAFVRNCRRAVRRQRRASAKEAATRPYSAAEELALLRALQERRGRR